jgi:hypothetical protein
MPEPTYDEPATQPGLSRELLSYEERPTEPELPAQPLFSFAEPAMATSLPEPAASPERPTRSYIEELLAIEAEAAASRALAEAPLPPITRPEPFLPPVPQEPSLPYEPFQPEPESFLAPGEAAAPAAVSGMPSDGPVAAAPYYDAGDTEEIEADHERVSTSPSSDVFARLPSCEMALEAGRAVSECAFNSDEIADFGAELDQPLGRLINALGGSWEELRTEQSFEGWMNATDALLRVLPEEARRLEDWYKLGFELATLHNLAGQLALDGADAAAEQKWRSALERFLMRAERAEIGYENLGRVLGLLENLAGPGGERDLSNIGRSLEELRRHAAGADAIHTAA